MLNLRYNLLLKYYFLIMADDFAWSFCGLGNRQILQDTMNTIITNTSFDPIRNYRGPEIVQTIVIRRPLSIAHHQTFLKAKSSPKLQHSYVPNKPQAPSMHLIVEGTPTINNSINQRARIPSKVESRITFGNSVQNAQQRHNIVTFSNLPHQFSPIEVSPKNYLEPHPPEYENNLNPRIAQSQIRSSQRSRGYSANYTPKKQFHQQNTSSRQKKHLGETGLSQGQMQRRMENERDRERGEWRVGRRQKRDELASQFEVTLSKAHKMEEYIEQMSRRIQALKNQLSFK